MIYATSSSKVASAPSSASPNHIGRLLPMLAMLAAIFFSGCSGAKVNNSDDARPAKSKADQQVNSTFSKNTPEPALAPGFLIGIHSTQDQNLNGSFRIDSSGEIRLPYNVMIETNGLTWDKFRSTLEDRYRPYFKGSPNLSISLLQKRYWVIVNGLVEKPGEVLVKHDASLDEIISGVGGLGEDMDTGFVRVKQGDQTNWVDLGEYFRYGKADQVPLWFGGDTLFFQKEGSRGGAGVGKAGQPSGITVLGEVKTPGDSTFVAGADFYYYLRKMGGPSAVANLDNIELLRMQQSKRESVFRGSAGDLPQLAEGDMIIIYHDKATMFERVMAVLGTAASAISVVILAAIAL